MHAPPVVDRKQLRKFGLVMPIPLTLIATFLFFKDRHTAAFFLLGIALAFLLLGLAAPLALRPVYRGWMAFARVLGYINARIILSIVFFLVIAPMAILFRILGKDPLERKLSRDAATYWVKRDPSSMDRARYERQF